MPWRVAGCGASERVRFVDMDAVQFIQQRQRGWHRLEGLLTQVRVSGFRSLSHRDARELAALYRQASSDLIEVRSQIGSHEIESYLNDLVGRAYGHLYSNRHVNVLGGIRDFLTMGFPRLARQYAPYLIASIAIFLLGGVFGYGAMVVDPDAPDFLVPAEFDVGAHFRDPEARVTREEETAEILAVDEQAAFGSYLFARNTTVAFLAFAIGIAGGVLTAVVLFYNGIILGAFAASYVRAGYGLFFFAWVLPHGVPEIFSICLAGAAGLILGRAVIAPGRLTRQTSLRVRGRDAVLLALGAVPLLMLAGLIEGTISQMHEPVVTYEMKLTLAFAEAVCLACYLLFAGRKRGGEDGQ